MLKDYMLNQGIRSVPGWEVRHYVRHKYDHGNAAITLVQAGLNPALIMEVSRRRLESQAARSTLEMHGIQILPIATTEFYKLEPKSNMGADGDSQ